MADEATTEEQQPAEAEEQTTEPQEGAEGEQPGDGDRFDPDKALEKIRKLNSENKNLRESKKAAEQKAAGADELTTRVKALEAENLRIRIGAKHGLPEELINRLQGDTEEEILADAEKLLDLVSVRKAPPSRRPTENLRGGTEPAAEPEERDLDKLASRMFRR